MTSCCTRLKSISACFLLLVFTSFASYAAYAEEPCLSFKVNPKDIQCRDGNIQGAVEVHWNYGGPGSLPNGTAIEFDTQPSTVLDSPIASHAVNSNPGAHKITFSINNANISASGAMTIKAKYKVPDPGAGTNRFTCCEGETTVKLDLDCTDEPQRPKTRGMTWGFGGYSDIQGCDDGRMGAYAKLACITHPINATPDNWCNTPYSNYYANQDTPLTGNATRQCDPVNGDTECTESRHVLCISEPDNPYYHHLPPYDDPNTTITPSFVGYSPYGVPPFPRKPYKLHPPNPALVTATPPQSDEYYDGWVDQYVKLSRNLIQGNQLSLAVGNDECGPGWRMARFDDGKWIPGMNEANFHGNSWTSATIPKQSGGWAFHSVLAPDVNIGAPHPGDTGLNRRTNFFFKRYWVHSTLGGNCY